MSNPRIFSSVPQHQEHAHSDIDLLVYVDPDLDLLDLIDAASELEVLPGRAVDLITSRSLRYPPPSSR
ncbi:putative nucleotidyltransferase [Brachybacterium muris]|uniref:nucleotidyltransferase domain-containing protein n=1 Tax=Brachybacterium muris TaxID=219301 RepID=UPI00195EE952|nr:nucleotidyltransferase domain-containing protein [Brachybacterium muris]MBM7500877.1 putative nucleotidyltransferase [Brachybacterium muris]